jgi:putative methyltransferase
MNSIDERKPKLNFHLFNPSTEVSDIVIIPYTWLLIKTYFENNAAPEIQQMWHWPEPICDTFDEEAILSELEKYPPRVFGLSCYVWNESLCHSIARKVKEKWPACLVILGGPQQNSTYNDTFFQRHSYIDLLCKPEGYGEVFVKTLLEQISQDRIDFSEIPFAIYPTDTQLAVKNNQPFRFKDFTWQKGMFSQNRSYLEKRASYAKSIDKSIYSAYETSRGCPYTCSFCEWGGASSKVSFKNIDYILEDLTDLATAGIEYLEIIDANFGIVERDVMIADKLVELKNSIRLPISIGISGTSKNNKKYVNIIHEKTVAAGLLPEIKISVQDFDPVVLPHINRIDRPWQEQLLAARNIAAKYPVDIRFDMIQGLPGSTLSSFKESLHIEYTENVDTIRYIWFLLKDTPAYSPTYQAKNQIETAEVSMLKIGIGNNKVNYFTVNNPPPMQTHFVVIKTFSYSVSDWIDMQMLNHFKEAGRKTLLLQPVFAYESKQGTHVGNLIYSFYQEVLLNPKFLFSKWVISAKNEIEHSLKNNGNVEYVRTPFNSPFMIQLTSYFVLTITFYKDEFYKALDQWLSQTCGDDARRTDLISFIRQSVITADTDIDNHLVSTEYNWLQWIQSNYLDEINPARNVLKAVDQTYGPFADTLRFSFSDTMQKIGYTIKSLSYITHSHLLADLHPASEKSETKILVSSFESGKKEWNLKISQARHAVKTKELGKANEIMKSLTADRVFQHYLNQSVPKQFQARFFSYCNQFTFEIYTDLGYSKPEPAFTCCNNPARYLQTVHTYDDLISQFLHVITHEICAELWVNIDIPKDSFDLVTRDFFEEIFGVFIVKNFYPQFSNHFFDYCLKFAKYIGIEISNEFIYSFSVFSAAFTAKEPELKEIFSIYSQPQQIFESQLFKNFILACISFSKSNFYKDYISVRYEIDRTHKHVFKLELELN